MTFLKALRYFVQEAFLNLFRGWKVSLVAILTIAVSLFLAGVFLLTSGNLRQQIESWYDESKIVLYLESDATDEARAEVGTLVKAADWVESLAEVDSETAHERFREAFPSMSDLLEGWNDDPLPGSLEVQLDWQAIPEEEPWLAWIESLRQHPAVSMVDDDRDWLNQLQTVLMVIEGLGFLIGGILLFTAIFTISSVIRLTAYLYRDEIAVMRLVGATEFFIRGPFYMEGLLQGLAGGVLANASLWAVFQTAHQGTGSILSTVFLTDFLPPRQILLLVALGALSGVIGAMASLRRENLGVTGEAEHEA